MCHQSSPKLSLISLPAASHLTSPCQHISLKKKRKKSPTMCQQKSPANFLKCAFTCEMQNLCYMDMECFFNDIFNLSVWWNHWRRINSWNARSKIKCYSPLSALELIDSMSIPDYWRMSLQTRQQTNKLLTHNNCSLHPNGWVDMKFYDWHVSRHTLLIKQSLSAQDILSNTTMDYVNFILTVPSNVIFTCKKIY